jgi:hypothetical protein
MRWVITDDCLDGGRDIGAGRFPCGGALDELPYRFRLLDDDGEVYYLGRSDDQDSEAAFAPLDWAADHAGCAEIQYWRDGRWETL